MPIPFWVNEADFLTLMYNGDRDVDCYRRLFANGWNLMRDLNKARTRASTAKGKELYVSINVAFTRLPVWITEEKFMHFACTIGKMPKGKAARIWLNLRAFIWEMDCSRFTYFDGAETIKVFVAMT